MVQKLMAHTQHTYILSINRIRFDVSHVDLLPY